MDSCYNVGYKLAGMGIMRVFISRKILGKQQYGA